MTTLVGVDVGGTFTDVVRAEDGRITVTKVPTDLVSSDRSVLTGAEAVDVGSASVFNLASTAGLNAVITRRTPKIALLTTLGHRDVLDQARLVRPLSALTDPTWRREFGDAERPLIPRYLRRGIRERMDASGEVLIALDEAQAREDLELLKRCGVEGIAISLLHSPQNGAHEEKLLGLVREVLGDLPCSVSSQVSPLINEFRRTMTTVVDAIMKVKYSDYTDRLSAGLADAGFGGAFNYSDCAARLLPVDYALGRPYRLVVGGPAAGTAAAAHFGKQAGYSDVLCADVGGTSCDISLVIDGAPLLSSTFELELELHVSALSTDVVTLGAGGGSIVWVTPSGDIGVGPDSAGSTPGPACYGKGGERPTLTDAAVMIGILDGDQKLGGRVALDVEASQRAFEALETPLSVGERVDYAWRTGVQNIAEGLMNICIRHGLDPRDFEMMAFGAAGGMLLPSVLHVLPLKSVVIPPHTGLFSALGMLSADQVFSDHRSANLVLDAGSASAVDEIFTQLEEAVLRNTPEDATDRTVIRSFDGRFRGQSTETAFIEVPDGPIDEQAVAKMVTNFRETYQQRFGNAFEHLEVQGVTFRVEVKVRTNKVEFDKALQRDGGGPTVPTRTVPIQCLAGVSGEAHEYQREDLRFDDHIAGPAIIREPMSTTFVPSGTVAVVGGRGELIISAVSA